MEIDNCGDVVRDRYRDRDTDRDTDTIRWRDREIAVAVATAAATAATAQPRHPQPFSDGAAQGSASPISPSGRDLATSDPSSPRCARWGCQSTRGAADDDGRSARSCGLASR